MKTGINNAHFIHQKYDINFKLFAIQCLTWTNKWYSKAIIGEQAIKA